MNVLTLTSQDQVDKYSSNSCKLLKEGNYDKVVFNGIANLSGNCASYMEYEGFLFYAPEIEIQNCTMDGRSIWINNIENPVKITIKDSTIQDVDIRDIHTSLSVIMDNVTMAKKNNYMSIWFMPFNGASYTGNKSLFSIKNSKNINFYHFEIDTDICDVELSNNYNMKSEGTSLKLIPNDEAEQSKYLSQFTELTSLVTPSKIDECNYQFDQADWDKLISLLDTYPNLFHKVKFSESFNSLLYEALKTNDVYIHIPSLTFPACWIFSLDYVSVSKLTSCYDSVVAKDYAYFYMNKNNGHNFTITHFNEFFANNAGTQYLFQGLLIADNYKDFIAARKLHITGGNIAIGGTAYGLGYGIRPNPFFYSILSGKMVTSEITLMPNTYFRIRTVDRDMKIKSIKEVTRFHARTIKVTGMSPFMILSVAMTKCFDIDGEIEIIRARTSSKVFLNGDIIVPDIKNKIITGKINVQSIVSTIIITGEITINQDHIVYDLDGSFQLAQAISTDIIGDIEVKVCRIEILGSLEISMKGV